MYPRVNLPLLIHRCRGLIYGANVSNECRLERMPQH